MTDRVDVSDLKPYAFGYDAPIWWGQLLMTVIEGMMIVLLIAGYFYIRMQFINWPPPGSNTQGLLLPTMNVLLLIGSCIPMHMGDKAVLKCDWVLVRLMMSITILMGIVALGLQVFIWSRFEFNWYTNIYGSFVWTLLGVHTMHMVAALIETILMGVLPVLGYKSDKVRQALNVDEVYWYFVVVSAVLVYATVFFAPRLV